MASAVSNGPVSLSRLQRATTATPQEYTTQPLPVGVHHESDVLDIDRGDSNTGSVPRAENSTVHPAPIGNDPLIDSYYKNFHICHPFVLPRNHMTKLYQDPSSQHQLAPLVAVLRFMGKIYNA